MGMQIRVSAKIVPIHQNNMMPPRIFVARRNAGVMKIRWNNIKTEILVRKSAVHWIVPTVYHSWDPDCQYDPSRKGSD